MQDCPVCFSTGMMASLLALSTPVPGILTGEVVLCRVTLRGPGDTQGQVLHWADLRLLELLHWSIEPVLNPTTIFRERSANQMGERNSRPRELPVRLPPPTTISQQFPDHTVIEL